MKQVCISAVITVVLVLSGLTTAIAQHDAAHHEATTEFGEVHFPISCSATAQEQFDHATAMLHSFFYPETIKAYAAITASEPECAMAYWGIAMSVRQNPLIPVDATGLQPGLVAIEQAKEAMAATPRERDWIAALDSYYHDLGVAPHARRVLDYEAAMEALHQRYPDDTEAAVFYALALNEAADLADKTYARQIKAVNILNEVLAVQPNHPGVPHYIIHSYDFAPLASLGLSAAESYASVAPAAPHALHMPSHIFSVLGTWEEVISSNLASEAAARNYNAANFPGQRTLPWHSWDFRIHAHLQLAQDAEAERILRERNSVTSLDPIRLPNDTAFAAIPVRFVIERAQWAAASALDLRGLTFPQAQAIIVFGRALGAAHVGATDQAAAEVERLAELRDALSEQNDAYWSEQVEIQRLAGAAWLALARGDATAAIDLMRAAADLEDRSEKHIAMENRLVPMRELLGDLLWEAGQPRVALAEYEASLQQSPNRFRSFFGAAQAAEQIGDPETARHYYQLLLTLTAHGDTDRPELAQARAVVGSQ